MNIIQQILPFAGQLAIGIAAGALLCAAGFCDNKENRAALQVSGSRLITAALSFLGTGTLVIQLFNTASDIIMPAAIHSVQIFPLPGAAMLENGPQEHRA